MYVRDYHYDALVALPWIQDGVSASEFYGVSALTSAANYIDILFAASETDRVFSALLGRPWIRDGLTEEEADTINAVSILGILEMPFMDTFEILDYTAVRFLELLINKWDGRYLQQVLNHPSFSGGITDTDTVILSALFRIFRFSPQNQEIVESLLILLDPDERYQQERTIVSSPGRGNDLDGYPRHSRHIPHNGHFRRNTPSTREFHGCALSLQYGSHNQRAFRRAKSKC